MLFLHRELDPVQGGRPIRAFVDMRLRREVTKATADAALTTVAAVIDATHVTGRYDYQLLIAAKDVADLDLALNQLSDIVGAQETQTRLALRSLPGFPRSPSLQ